MEINSSGLSRGFRVIGPQLRARYGILLLAGLFAIVAFHLLLAPTTSAVTTVPTKLNFQGRLTDAAGSVKPSGTYNMKFRLFTVASGGSSVWTEDRLVSASQGVTVTNGQFSVQLGSVTSLPASLFASGALYLEIELPTPATATTSSPTWTEGAMTPRNQMATSAYAYNAETLDGQDGAWYQDAGNLTGTVNSARLSGSYAGITTVGNLTGLTTTGGLTVSGTNGTYSTWNRAISSIPNNASIDWASDGSWYRGFGATTGKFVWYSWNGTNYHERMALDSSNGNLSLQGSVSGTILTSTVATGTAPLTVTSTTLVANLNADLLDGQNGAYYQSATNLNAGTINTARVTGSYTGITGTGALAAGSITSGFGTISTANTITGTTLNGTTGINTGAGAGTQRIDASGNLVNVGNVTVSGSIVQGGYDVASSYGTFSENLVLNPRFLDGTRNWEKSLSSIWSTPAVSDAVPSEWSSYQSAIKVARVTQTTSSDSLHLYSNEIPLDPTQTYYVEVWARRVNAGDARVYFGVKKDILSNGGHGHYFASDISLPTTWTKYSTTIGPNGAQNWGLSDAKTFRFEMIGPYSQTTPTTIELAQVVITPISTRSKLVVGGDLNVSGSGSLQVGGTSIVTSGRALQNVISVTSSGAISGTQLISTVATGTAPITVSSTTKVTSLNADLLDGLDSTAFGDATAANQTTILNRIGTNADAAGTSTIFARLASIDTSKLGATGDAASSTGSIFARLAYLISSIGATNDAASSTGSVNAKLAYIIANSSAAKTQYFAEFTTSGSWTTPAGVTAVEVFLVGGGGGGGDSNSSCNTSGLVSGGGGGGGGIIKKMVTVTPGSSNTITIGSGGTGGSSSNGTAGSNSTFAGLTATGGGGGTSNGSGGSAGKGGGGGGIGGYCNNNFSNPSRANPNNGASGTDGYGGGGGGGGIVPATSSDGGGQSSASALANTGGGGGGGAGGGAGGGGSGYLLIKWWQ